jgi:hypothetical protein
VNSFKVSSIVFGCVFGGALFGLLLQSNLPPEQLGADTKDAVRLGMGLIGTIAALVLGLLIASAKNSYDVQRGELVTLSSTIALLDLTLVHYGPETKETRNQLRSAAAGVYDQMWPRDHSEYSSLEPSTIGSAIYDSIQRLSPKDDAQRSLQVRALSYAHSLGQTRWLMYAESGMSVPLPLLVVVVAWLTLIFISFGLFAPVNAIVVASLFVSSWSVSCAILLILDMYKPYRGLIQISSAPLLKVISRLGQ